MNKTVNTHFVPNFIFLALVTSACGEDWKTSDGKTYQDVKIVHNDTVYVTILDSDGGAKIAIKDLPADLQTKLGFNPQTAQKWNEESERETYLKVNKRRGSGHIVQVMKDGIITNLFCAVLVERDYIGYGFENAYIVCDTTGLQEGQDWGGIVWKTGTYSYTSAAGAAVLQKYTTSPDEAYAASKPSPAPNSSTTAHDYSVPVADRPEWTNTLSELSLTLDSLKKDGGTFTAKGMSYAWKEITKVTPGELSYMTDTGAGTIPVALLSAETIKLLGLTPDTIGKWDEEQKQQDLANFEANQALLQAKHAKDAQEAAISAARAQAPMVASGDRAKAREMALQQNASLGDKVESLYQDLQDLKQSMDEQKAALDSAIQRSNEGGSGALADAITSKSAYQALQSQYDRKMSRYEDAKSEYDRAVSDGEYQNYQAIVNDELARSRAERDAEMRQVAPSPATNAPTSAMPTGVATGAPTP